MNFTSLIYFVNIAELGSLSAAARLLHVAQPALSRHIKGLEADLGFKLFERHSNGVTLSRQGQAFYDQSRGLVSGYQKLAFDFHSGRDDIRGKVVIGLPRPFSGLLSALLQEEADSRYPGLELRFIEESRSGFKGEWLDWLKQGELDLVLGYDNPGDPAVAAETLAVEPVLLCAGAEAGVFTADPASLLHDNALMVPRYHPHYQQFLDRELMGREIKPHFSISCDGWDDVVRAIRRSEGIGYLPYSFIADHMAHGEIQVHPSEGWVLDRAIHCLSRAMQSSAAIRHVRSRITKASEIFVRQKIWKSRVS